jgi:hypothetical protein
MKLCLYGTDIKFANILLRFTAGADSFPRALEPPPDFRCQKKDMKLDPYWLLHTVLE